jgi:hypothetical protein
MDFHDFDQGPVNRLQAGFRKRQNGLVPNQGSEYDR